ncbi:uncharacterized protein BDV14DRAFT_197371 [Aspergillus stella-maris]|uniref:uncharacterized protein n=1 Tax=Aspergillus stella-maris TaxID=1810926 RepID=UPI003CCE3FD9
MKFLLTLGCLIITPLHLAKRSRPKCGPSLASNDSKAASNVGFIRFECNSTSLQKRMTLPDGDIGNLNDKALPNLTEAIVPDGYFSAPTTADLSTAVMKKFGSVGRRKKYSTGTSGLSGCTTMYVISRKGVYATHWWENLSFAPDPEWRGAGTSTDEELFQATVIDLLKDGGKYHPRLDARLIEDDYIRAYLLHPKQPHRELTDGSGYPDQWEKIRTTVGELVPKLQDRSRWTGIPYKGLNADDENLFADGGTAGKNFIKYGPSHDFGGFRGALAMLWVEGQSTPYHEDIW